MNEEKVVNLITKTIKLIQIKSVENSLVKLLSTDLPIKTAYRLSKLAKSIKKELEHIEEFRVNLVKKHGTVDDKGNTNVTPENLPAFNKDYSDLMNTECQVSFFEIKIHELGDAKLSALDILNIEGFTKE